MSTGGRRSRTVATAGPHLERLLWRVGVRHVAGVDEVGMGPLAGPVVAAAVVLPVETHIDGVADSKVLSAAVRELLATEIRRRALGVGIAVVEPEEIDRVNIYQAGLRALRRAVELRLAASRDVRLHGPAPPAIVGDGHGESLLPAAGA